MGFRHSFNKDQKTTAMCILCLLKLVTSEVLPLSDHMTNICVQSDFFNYMHLLAPL